MKKNSIHILMIFPNFNISGVLSYALNLIRCINQMDLVYQGELVVFPNEPIDDEHRESYCGVPVRVLPIEHISTSSARLQILIDYINQHERAIICPNYCFNIQPILPFLHEGIKKMFVLHSDEKIYYESARLFSSYYDALVGVSSHIVHRLGVLDGALKQKMSMIQYGVDIAEEYQHSTDETIRIVYFGRIVEEQKRVSRMVDMIQALAKTEVDFHWSFVGEGSEIETLQRQLSAFIAEERVSFLPAMTVSQVQAFAYSQDVYVLTSDYEGTPLALLEAMGCGCIPIVNDIKSGIPEMLTHGQTGFIVPEASVDGYVAYIKHLYDNPTQKAALSQACYAHAKEHFSTPVMAKKYCDVFDTMMEQSAPTRQTEFSSSFSLAMYHSFIPLISSDITSPILEKVSSIAIFGWGVSGQRTYHFLETKYSGKIKCIIDDGKSGSFNGVPIVRTEEFFEQMEAHIQLVVFGAYQKLNPDLLKRLNIPYVRLSEVI